MWICFAYLFVAFGIALTWSIPQLGRLPNIVEQWMYPIDKTDLDVLRFAHFLALAAITVRFLPRDWPGLKSPWLRPLILCGQHSLEIFCLGVFLAFAGHFVLAEVSGGAAMHLLVSVSGILIMWGMAWVISWYKHSADKGASKTKSAPGNADHGGRGRMRSACQEVLVSRTWLGVTLLATVAGDRRCRARRGCAAALRCACLSLDQRKRASESRRSRQKGQPLTILVVGSRSSSIPSLEASAYPARLQAALKERLPQLTINLSVELQSAKTAEEAAGALVKLVEAKKPTLVVWQTGTVDAMRSIDPDDFRSALDEGVGALQTAGADVVLVNLQYSPRTETMISAPPYLDNMRVVAQQHEVPLFDRFAIMRHWNDAGDFDLFSTAHGLDLVKRVHACLGRALSKFVIDSAHLDAAQQN